MHMRRIPVLLPAVLAVATFLVLPSLAKQDIPFALALLWEEDQRAFLQDGPGLLLSAGQLDELLHLDGPGRAGFITKFLSRDPIPDTPDNELVEGIRRRRALVQMEHLTFQDARAQLLFLHGMPRERKVIECAETYQPLEIWTYGSGEDPSKLVIYRPDPSSPYRVWRPIDSKRVLYGPEMEYFLDQWEELRRFISGGRRFDRNICDESEEVDLATGVDGLFGFMEDRPTNDEVMAFFRPPSSLAAWARQAASEEAPGGAGLEGGTIDLYFPEREGQRLLSRFVVVLPPEVTLEPFAEGDKEEVRLSVEGHLERDGKIFETFRMRFQVPPPKEEVPVALLVDRKLRPDQEFLARLRVRDEISDRQILLTRGFVVPRRPTEGVAEPPVPEEAIVALGEAFTRQTVAGYDSLLIVPPETDVIFGLWRAETVVTGTRIAKVVFYVDGKELWTKKRPPYSAELRLETYPREQVVRVEGYDSEGALVASDEVVINQPRGELAVRILEPPRGRKVGASVLAKAEVVVPEEKFVEKVEFIINEELLATVEQPPWEASLAVPVGGELTYLTVAAYLDDGSRAEDVRFLNSPQFLEEVDVNLVELYTTVNDKSGRLAKGLTAADFQVWEDGRPQKIAKFELVENLPLTLGITIDTSGSMFESLGEAQRAAIGFLDNIITQRDRCFAVAFADRPALLMPRTSDVGAVAERVQDLVASGATSLHDALVTSLYYYRGIRGRRALVLLSDGDDTSSTIEFRDALEYAKRSGVSIYAIGLGIGRTDIGVRRKLENLSQETGGRAFFIRRAEELEPTYREIEEELRSQYLVAYNSDRPGGTGEYREVTVKVSGGKLKARTIKGYYS